MNCCRRVLSTGIFWWALLAAGPLWAQLDTLHWIPPMYALAGMGPQFIDLSTPETTPFTVVIRDGAGAQVTTAQISRNQPFRYLLSDTYSQLLVPDLLVGKALPAAGLVLRGPKPFYATFRAHSAGGADACHLTCKGRAALGKTFRIGHLFQVTDKAGGRANFIGVMATTNGTKVTFSGFDPTTMFTGQTQVDTDGKVRVTLQKGQSVVWAHYVGGIEDEQPRNAFMGALVEATAPVAVNCGSWLGAPVVYQVNDIALDQTIPVERTGKEYIVCRGHGPTSLEHPIIIAHENNTAVWLNGSDTPAVTLNAGKFFLTPSARYSPDGNLYIRSSKPVYVYQMTGGVPDGKYSLRQASLMLVPPLNCGIAHSAGPIVQPVKTGDVRFDGGLTIVALRDSTVDLRVNGAPVSPGPPAPVPGNPDFVTYRPLDLFVHTKASTYADVTLRSGGSIQVALLSRYLDAGFSAFFSGFQERPPAVQLSLAGDGVCPDTLRAEGFFDGLLWVYDGVVRQSGPDTQFIARAPGPYKAVAYQGGCFHTAIAADSVKVPLTAPQFPYTLQNAACFGAADGWIHVGQPLGGAPPYQFSIDDGAHLGPGNMFEGLRAGAYVLVVQDASGCSNQPVHLQVGQPDSFYVDIVPQQLPDPLHAGEAAELLALSSQPAVALQWAPGGDCPGCFTNTLRLDTSTWITVTALDSTGCRATDSLLLLVDPLIYAPNAIAPASSRGNERFMLFSKDPLPIHRLRIFDRWGNLVFERAEGWTNDPADGWDGHYGGKTAAPGVYVFWADVEIEPGRVLRVRGDVTVF